MKAQKHVEKHMKAQKSRRKIYESAKITQKNI
jgi:hypothetical protein